MSDYTREELEQMMMEKDDEELNAFLTPTTYDITRDEILSASDCVEYILRDSDKFDNIIYSHYQSATIGKRFTEWIKYKPIVENGVITQYLSTDVSGSFSTDLNEVFSQTELIIEE